MLRQRVLDAVARCRGRIVVHTGSWRHDLDQARCLPTQPGLKVQVSPRAARARTSGGCCPRLLPDPAGFAACMPAPPSGPQAPPLAAAAQPPPAL